MLMPSSQLLFFHYLYGDEPDLYTNNTAERLNLSAMQISRAVKQLKALGLMTVRKDGVRLVMTTMESRYDLFKRARPHLLDPVRKKVYVEFEAIPNGLPLSGLSALSELSMLNPSTVKTLAFHGSVKALIGTDELIDHNSQAEVEIWHYAPALLSNRPDMVDILSLVTSMQSLDDERIEQAVDEALSNLWGVEHGNRIG
jgi:hypothetical protein